MGVSRTALVLAGLVACGGGGGSDQQDASVIDPDAGVDALVDSAITGDGDATFDVSGKAVERQNNGTLNAVQFVQIATYSATDETTALATGMTDSTGAFTLAVPVGAQPAFIRATKNNYKDTYMYPGAPITGATMNLSVRMLRPTAYTTLVNTGNQNAGNGFVVVTVLDTAGMPVAGATVATTPTVTTYYGGMGGTPTSSAIATAADGLAYIYNVPPGTLTIQPNKTAATFASVSIKVRADVLTTTFSKQQ